MAVYYILQLLILGLAWPLCLRKPTQIKKAAYLAVTFGYMWFLAAFRSGIGFDYQSYIDIFEGFRKIASPMEALRQQWEPGFNLLNWLLSRFVTSSVVLYGIYSLLIFVPVAVGIYFYCRDAWLSTWTYVMLSYFYTAMNFIRQGIACGIVLLSYRFLRDKKPVPFVLMTLLAASFHKTALIMLPLYFLAQLRLTPRTGAIYGVVAVGAYLASPWLMDFALQFIFSQYRDTMYVDTTYGFSAVFLLVPFSVLGICLALLPVWKNRDPHAELLTSMMIFSAVIWLFITHHFILERFSHYSYILALIAVPTALSALQATPEDREKLALLEAQSSGRKKAASGKEQHAEERRLRQHVGDHQKYYWAAVAGFLLVTWLYNEFGQHVNGFHNVFPYQSVLW